jgi:tRNA A-37 threonylcarbamoyl transferase component Bud32
MQLVGSTLGGDFRIVSSLGRGGMGEVFVAEQLSTGQKRAIKIMHPTLVQDPRLRERFEQEARVGAQVQSEHVVRVIAAGVDNALGIPWLAMELLNGEDLGAFAKRRGPLPLPEVIPIFRQLCHALGAAHDGNIVHRDVKPENVFLASVQSADSHWQVRVLDFGIAKLMADARQSATAQVGTPLWMAPEQSDATQPVLPAADVWSLGLIAFWLLTGRSYWKTANLAEPALTALFRETLFDPIVPATERARELGISLALPAGFDAWFARCVVRDPTQRFSHARDAFQGLEAVGRGSLTQPSAPAILNATPLAPPEHPSKKSSPVLWIVLGLGGLVLAGVVVVLAAGVLGALFFTRSAAPPVAVTVAPAPVVSAAPVPVVELDSGASPVTTTTSGQVAPAPAQPGAKNPAAETSAPGKTETPAPAPEAAKGDGLKPIDRGSVQALVNKTAAAAAVECRQFKSADAGVESYTGTAGFRPDGSSSGGMQGPGGSRSCVQTKMFGMKIGKYAHPQEWHVEVFSWSVSVK